jgi:SWI/SNF-related matrix-associated actin-dependent regulator of chromatin subfamily A3
MDLTSVSRWSSTALTLLRITLSPQDQQKIQLAISLRRINAEDIPESAKVNPSSSGINHEPNSAPSGKKRKADEHVSQTTASQARNSHPSGSQIVPPSTQLVQDDSMEEAAEEVKDELYCTLVTSVVGIQYYKGLSICRI